MGNRRLTFRRNTVQMRKGLPFSRIVRIWSYGQLDGVLTVCRKKTGQDCQIFFSVISCVILSLKSCGRCFIFCKNDNTGSFSIQPSYGTNGYLFVFLMQIPVYLIGKTVVIMFSRGMCDKTGGLVYSQNVTIFIQDPK